MTHSPAESCPVLRTLVKRGVLAIAPVLFYPTTARGNCIMCVCCNNNTKSK